MMKHEFEKLAGYEVSNSDYDNIIEPMYMATNMSKAEFVKCIDKKRFALPTQKAMLREMKKQTKALFEICGVTSIEDEITKLQRLAEQYAERFYGIGATAILTRDYAYCGVEQERGCTCPKELVIYGSKYAIETVALR